MWSLLKGDIGLVPVYHNQNDLRLLVRRGAVRMAFRAEIWDMLRSGTASSETAGRVLATLSPYSCEILTISARRDLLHRYAVRENALLRDVNSLLSGSCHVFSVSSQKAPPADGQRPSAGVLVCLDYTLVIYRRGGTCWRCIHRRLRASYPLRSMAGLPLRQRHGLPERMPTAGAVARLIRQARDTGLGAALVSDEPGHETETVLPCPDCQCEPMGPPPGRPAPSMLVGWHAGLIRDVIVRPSGSGSYEARTVSSCRPEDLGTLPAPLGGAAVREDQAAARAIALFEAAERYCGSFVPGRIIRVRPADVIGPSVAPGQLSQMYLRGTLHQPAGTNADHHEIGWTAAIRTRDGAAGLVPAAAVFAPYKFTGEPRWIIPISTGLAAGASPDDAYGRALLEVIERDAWGLTWEQRLTPDQLRPCCRAVEWMIHEVACGQVSLHLLPTDHGIPVVMSWAHGQLAGKHANLFSCKAALTLHEAAMGSLSELVQRRLHVSGLLNNRSVPEHAAGVKTMDDHALYYCRRDRSHELAFLSSGSTAARACDREQARDGGAEVASEVVRALTAVGLEAWTANITTKDVRHSGISVVRALVPGMIPIGYGRWSQHRMPRLFELPKILGRTPRYSRHEALSTLPRPSP